MDPVPGRNDTKIFANRPGDPLEITKFLAIIASHKFRPPPEESLRFCEIILFSICKNFNC